MDLIDEVTAPPPPVKRARWILSPALIISVVLHLLFGGVAAYYVVSRYSASRKLTFQGGPKSPNPSEQALQHRVQLDKKMKSQSVPTAVPKRVLTTGLAKIALPAMPEIPGPKNAQSTPLMSAGGQAGNFAAGGAPSAGSLGGTGSGATINFFGIRDISNSIVIMIDISDSMFGRTGDYDYNSRKLLRLGKEQSFQAVRDEAEKLIQSLTPATSFGIVRWSGSAISWKPTLVPATDENKKAAIAHIESDLDIHKASRKGDRPGGTRHDYALEEAFKLKPQTIYMLTDGNAAGKSTVDPSRDISPEDIYKVLEEGEKALSKKAKLHTIYYLTGKDKPEEERMLRQLSSRTGGTFQKIKPPKK